MNRGQFALFSAAAAASFALPHGVRAETYAVQHDDATWRRILGDDRFAILRGGDTEMPYSSPLNAEHRRGMYHCAGCGQTLFSSTAKYDSGEGWPSFWTVLPNVTKTRTDNSWAVEQRTEVHCSRCGSHLGHIFDDGPPPTNLRYCIDGLALNFIPK